MPCFLYSVIHFKPLINVFVAGGHRLYYQNEPGRTQNRIDEEYFRNIHGKSEVSRAEQKMNHSDNADSKHTGIHRVQQLASACISAELRGIPRDPHIRCMPSDHTAEQYLGNCKHSK